MYTYIETQYAYNEVHVMREINREGKGERKREFLLSPHNH